MLLVVADSSSAISNECGPLGLRAAHNQAITAPRARACVHVFLHCCSCISLINADLQAEFWSLLVFEQLSQISQIFASQFDVNEQPWVSKRRHSLTWWREMVGCSLSPCHMPLTCCVVQVEESSRPDLGLFLLKYVMMLIVGIPSVFWVGSKKTCFEWASFFHGKRCKR